MANDTRTAGNGASQLPVDELLKEVQNLLGAAGERALGSLTDRLNGATDRLTEYAASGGRKLVEGAADSLGPTAKSAVAGAMGGGGVSGAAKGAAKGMAKGAMKSVGESVKNALGGGGSKKAAKRITNIVEHVDVGVPVSVAYNQWTLFADFPSFMRNVESVEQQEDEKLRWQAKIGLSKRTWESTIIEQVPDKRIVWQSTGDKGYVDGAVTFHELGPELTRVVLVLEYHPVGFIEKVANAGRFAGRHARGDLRHFQRYVMTNVILHPDEVEGWRGEIHDSEVTREPGEEPESEAGEGPESEAGEGPEAGEEPEAGEKRKPRRRKPDQQPEEDTEPESEADSEPESEADESEQPTRRRRPENRRRAGESDEAPRRPRRAAGRQQRPERRGERRPSGQTER